MNAVSELMGRTVMSGPCQDIGPAAEFVVQAVGVDAFFMLARMKPDMLWSPIAKSTDPMQCYRIGYAALTAAPVRVIIINPHDATVYEDRLSIARSVLCWAQNGVYSLPNGDMLLSCQPRQHTVESQPTSDLELLLINALEALGALPTETGDTGAWTYRADGPMVAQDHGWGTHNLWMASTGVIMSGLTSMDADANTSLGEALLRVTWR